MQLQNNTHTNGTKRTDMEASVIEFSDTTAAGEFQNSPIRTICREADVFQQWVDFLRPAGGLAGRVPLLGSGGYTS